MEEVRVEVAEVAEGIEVGGVEGEVVVDAGIIKEGAAEEEDPAATATVRHKVAPRRSKSSGRLPPRVFPLPFRDAVTGNSTISIVAWKLTNARRDKPWMSWCAAVTFSRYAPKQTITVWPSRPSTGRWEVFVGTTVENEKHPT